MEWRSILDHLDVSRHDDLLDALSELDQLCRAGCGVGFDLASLRPSVRLVVMIGVTDEEAACGLVHDEPDVASGPHGPEVLVLGLIEFVKLVTRRRRIDMQVEGRQLGLLRLVSSQS